MARGPQETEVIIGEVTYKVKKFTPDTACKWAFRLLGKMDLTGSMQNLSDEEKLKELTKKVETFTSMPEKDFKEFQNDCLKHVWAVYPAQTLPILNNDGTFNVTDIDNPTLFELTINSFMFTVIDFLDQAFLGRLMTGLNKMGDSLPSQPDQPSTP
jgi:hypothetical protein